MPTPARRPASSSNGFNLTKATEFGRIAIKIGVLAIVALMVGRMTINGIVAFWIATHPKPPPPPTQGFGLLPPIKFATSTAPTPASFVLELPGSFPFFSDRATVYFQPKRALNLLSLDQGRATAAQLGFTNDPTELSDDEYRWRTQGALNATLEMNIVTRNLTYTTDFHSRPELQVNNGVPTAFDAAQVTKSFFSAASLLPEDVATGAGKTKYLKIVGGTLKEAVSLSDAQVIQVDLFRTLPGETATYTAQGETGVLSAQVALIEGQPRVIHATRSYAPLDYIVTYTYPLRSTQDAWRDLQAGKGYITQAASGGAVIRSITLGYYESIDQDFLQPIYVFTGDDNFMGFISALSPLVVRPTTTSTTSTATH